MQEQKINITRQSLEAAAQVISKPAVSENGTQPKPVRRSAGRSDGAAPGVTRSDAPTRAAQKLRDSSTSSGQAVSQQGEVKRFKAMAKKGLFAAAVIVAMIGGAAAATFYSRMNGVLGRHNQTPAAAMSKVAYVEIKELTLRLADTSSEHYIKLTPVLAVRAGSTDDISTHNPVIRDRLVTLVSAHSSVDLATPQGETQLKRDILEALRNQFGDEVVGVYFTGYLVE